MLILKTHWKSILTWNTSDHSSLGTLQVNGCDQYAMPYAF